MSTRIENALARAKSGELTKAELESLKKNAIRIGGAEVVVQACDSMLLKLPGARQVKKPKPDKN